MQKEDKDIPIIYREKEECCGCTACVSVCPQKAITMIEDDEGFLYPVINETRCIQCYLCVTACPIKRTSQ